jgi:predicted nuclease of predicted toxin-antitoxin system
MIALYTDENVEGQIVRGLRARGIDVLTAEEDGYRETPDPKVLDRAAALDRVIFSRDEEFLREATRR